MRLFFFILLFFVFQNLFASDLTFYVDQAYKNNPKLNAERENLKAIKENINISKSEFLPSLTLSGTQESSQSYNRTNQSGSTVADISSDKETKSVKIDQKIFQGFQGVNSYKKSHLEFEKAKFQLKKIEQETILNSVIVYYDLIFKFENENFNSSNVNLFERQVESDRARLQKGEINLTDLAQSESSLAGASANLIKAQTELLASKSEFQRITRVEAPENENLLKKPLNISLPKDFKSALEIAKKNNPKLMIGKLDAMIAEKEFAIEKSKLSPTASINYSKSDSRDFSSSIDENNQETLKAEINWPIIKGGKNFSSIKKAKHKKLKNDLLLKDIENEVNTSTANAWSTYQSSKSILKSTKSQLQAAEIANEGITLEYDSGSTRTTLDVIQSRALLLNARIDNAKAERDLVISKFKLLDQLGNLSLNVIN